MNFSLWMVVKLLSEVLILAIVYYQVLVFFQGTRAFQVLKGIIYVLMIFLFAQILELDRLNWILSKLFTISILALVVIFQQEIRQGLARLGQGHLFRVTLEEKELVALIDEIVDAVFKLSARKIGCLIGVEREAQLKTYIESGIPLDALISSETLQAIFWRDAPMHDGGVIVRGPRIVAAACLFPLSENQNLSKIIGTRHRAALGLTEQTDAISVLVSEETGEISVACDGKFIPVAGGERLKEILKDLLASRPTVRKERT